MMPSRNVVFQTACRMSVAAKTTEKNGVKSMFDP